MRLLFRILRLLFRWFRIAVLLLVLAAIAALAYARLFGLPNAFTQRVVDEIAKKGVSVRFGRIYFDPFQGFVANDAVIFNPNDPAQQLVSVTEIGLKLDFQRLIHRQQALDELHIRGAALSIPLDFKQPQQSTVTGKGVSAAVRVEEGGIISVEGFSGVFNGVRVELSGTVHAFGGGGRAVEAAKLSQQTPPNALAQSFKEFENIRFTELPELYVQFHVDLDKPEVSTAHVLLKTKAFSREKLAVDSLQAQLTLANQAAHLVRLDIALYGGQIHITGDYNLGTGEAALDVRSDANLKQLTAALGPRPAYFFHEYEFGPNPIVTAHLEGPPRELGLLVMDGALAANQFAFRGIPVQSARSKFTMRDGIFKLPNLEVVRPEGTFRGTYTCRLKSEDFTLDGVSNVHPAPCRNIFPNHKAEFLRRFRFESPPTISFLWTGNWHDPEAANIKGHIHAGPFEIDDVTMQALDSDAELIGHVLTITNLVLTRTEGEVKGYGLYDGQARRLDGSVVSTANPYDLARVLGSNAVAAIAPYQFIQPPRLVLNGTLHFADDSRTQVLGHIEGTHLYWWRLHADTVTSDFAIRKEYVGLTNFAARICAGDVRGDAEFFTRAGETHYQINCRADKADLQQVAESITRKKQKARGQVAGWISLQGTPGDTRSIAGQGTITIDKGVLWEYPVFGELLSMAINTILPGKIATSTASNARGEFTLDQGVAVFSTLTVDAGMTSIVAKGRYKIWSGGLDFDVEGKPWNDVEWAKLFTWVTTPFTKLFTMHLGGTWETPDWRTVYLPKELLAPFKSGSPNKEKTEGGEPALPASPEPSVSDKPR